MPLKILRIPYELLETASNPVQLEVNVGHGQNCSSLTKLGSVCGTYSGSFKMNLGECRDLRGKSMEITSTIHDINPTTNDVYMDITLSGGKKLHQQVIIKERVAQSGSTANAKVTIYFR